MSDTNVGMGMVPHKATCGCAECVIDNLQAKRREQDNRIAELETEAANTNHSMNEYRRRIAELEAQKESAERLAKEQGANACELFDVVKTLQAGQQAAIDGALEGVAKELDGMACNVPIVSEWHCDVIDGLNKVARTIRARIGTNPLAELQAKARELEAENAELTAALTELMKYNPRTKTRTDQWGSTEVPTGAALLKVLDQCDAALRQRADQQDGSE